MADDVPTDLLELSRHLGDPARDYAILAEGNTSARAAGDDGTFWVKASGTSLGSATNADFVRVDAARVLGMLADEELADDDVRSRLRDARVGAAGDVMPSVETLMHAVFLGLDDVHFVGHTHPTPINMLTCTEDFEDAVAGRLFPDEIVLCGPRPLIVPYVDPGVPLARAIRRRLEAFVERWGERPRIVYLQNHGFVALGTTARQVQDITAMAVKVARIIVGTYAAGGVPGSSALAPCLESTHAPTSTTASALDGR